MIELIGTELYQWDTGRSVSVSGASHAHFANKGDSQAVIMELTDGSTLIPDYLLQTGKQLCVYAVNEGVTVETRIFSVRKRERPENYIYDEDRRNYIYALVQSAEEATSEAVRVVAEAEAATAEAVRIAEELKAAKENGEFNGPKGEPGVIRFAVVTELPAEGDGDTIYLMPTAGSTEENLFDEYIFVDGKWEKIGSASVAVNLDEYVKKTDAAELGGELGLVKLQNQPGYSGITLGPNGQLCLHSADSFAIDKKTNYRAPITPFVLDHAVKIGVTTNTETLTAEEKAAACEWLGAVEKLPIATGNERTRVNCNRYNHSTKDYTLVVDEYRTATNWAIPVRNSNGGIYIPDGAIKDDSVIPAGEVAVNRKYVDGLVGDIETALDGIIAIQNELIGGAGE